MVLGLTCTGCSNGGGAQAQVACRYVERSIALYDRSLGHMDPARVDALRAEALTDLRDAQPAAANAAGDDLKWQALLLTIDDSGKIPEGSLVDALGLQCAGVD